MTDGATIYDEVEYPASLQPTTLPSHLGALARLHGLTIPDPATARVLEIGGGDGINLLGMAASAPRAQFLSFDLSSAAVARGKALADAVGLDNIRIEVGDVIEAAETMEGPFDYVIAHGLYAWVPQVVRDAAMKLIGRVLSPEGVAFVSYNTTPGGWMRRAVREMMLFHIGQGTDGADGMHRARAFLADFAAARETDDLATAGLRQVARPVLQKSDGFLFHDDLGEYFAPVPFHEAVAHAEGHGLAFLNDALPALVFSGLPGLDRPDEAEVVRLAQVSDYHDMAFFHSTLFVRSGRQPLRRIEAASFADLYATSRVRRTGRYAFQFGDKQFEIEDDPLCDFLELLGQAAPTRLSLASFTQSQAHCEALVQLYQRNIIELHASPCASTREPGDRPRASPLALAQLAAGATNLFALNHDTIPFREAGPRAFLALLDGTRDRAMLEADWAASGFAGQVTVADALRQIGAAGMLAE